jgi:DNA-binding MarR family transcriptional regulator
MAKKADTEELQEGQDDKRQAGPPGANLAGFLVNASKISDSLQGAIVGDDANITLTDWLFLKALQTEGPLHASRIAVKVGITRQRVHQLISPLKDRHLIALVETSDKHNHLTLTPAGAELVQRLEDKFLALLSTDPHLPPESMLRSAHASTRRLLRVLTKVAKPDAE